jgi:hypothetical protein
MSDPSGNPHYFDRVDDWRRHPPEIQQRAQAMNQRVRHCVECPKCQTRYLLGFSPYRNGSYLLPLVPEVSAEWILYCSCAKFPVRSRWACRELDRYRVSRQAYGRGYGSAEEIVALVRGAT